jgi:hypothetical protein
MKRTFLLSIIFLLAGALNYSSQAQLGGLLNKVKNKVVDKALGNDSGKNGSQAKEPDCATGNDMVVFEFDKGFKVDMTEITVCIQNGDILLFSKLTGKYFVKKKNSDSPEGPYEPDNSEVTRFNCNSTVSSNDKKDFSLIYPEFVSRSGEKYLIQFGGKSYGPYAIIMNFVVSDLKSKFVAQVIPDMMFTEKESKELEKENKNADNMTMEQKMAMARKVQEKMMQKAASGNAMDFSMKVISNVPNVSENLGATVMYSSTIKFDEIVCLGAGQIMDLSGKTIFTYDMQKVNPNDGLWLSSDNSRYVTYSYGLLKFSDGKECNQVFSPWLVKEGDKLFLNYLYYSPKHNAIMQISNSF